MRDQREFKLFKATFKAIADNLPLDIWLENSKGEFLFVNKYMKDHPENNYMTVGNPISAGDIDRHFDLPTIKSIRFGEATHYRERTELGVYEIYRIPLTDREGTLHGYLGYTKDITHETLLYNFPGMAYRSKNDKNYTMTFLSHGCFELTGYHPEELIDKDITYYDLIQQPYRDQILLEWESFLDEYQIESKEYPITTAHGETKWVWELYQEWRNTSGQFIATEGFITDITERKVAEEALKKSEERFRAIYEKAPLGIGIFNSKSGVPVQLNKKFTEIVGRSEEELKNISWREYSHPDDIEENISNVRKMLAGEIPGFSMNKRYIRPDGTIMWVNMTIVPFQSPGIKERYHLSMIEDITLRKTVEEENLYLSYHDPLTGLYNRRYYETALKQIDNEENLPISVIVADVDNLKYINDTFGHLEGDQLLKQVADILMKECRKGDIIARIGGDEFVIILSKTEKEEAKTLVERINKTMETCQIKKVPTSVAFGVATKNVKTEIIINKFIEAENKMYSKKASKCC